MLDRVIPASDVYNSDSKYSTLLSVSSGGFCLKAARGMKDLWESIRTSVCSTVSTYIDYMTRTWNINVIH